MTRAAILTLIFLSSVAAARGEPPVAVATPVTTGALPVAEPARPVPAAAADPAGPVRLEHCLVSLIDDVEIPAPRAGVLTSAKVKEGDYAEKGTLLAQIDDEEAVFDGRSARADAEAAKAKAENLLDTEYAAAEHATRTTEYRMALEANQKQANSIALIELERCRLAAEQARIKISVAGYERRLRAVEAESFEAKARRAEADVLRRRLTAPVAGEIVEIFHRPGEWVEPGKPVLRIVRLDRLRVEGFVAFAEHSPERLFDRPVEIDARFTGGRVETFTGKVTFVSPLVQPGGEYRVWAEVENRRTGPHWLLRPGQIVDMRIGK
jgi:multidrug efflux pump subunit AcrA (membrane-fusion protein)